MTTGTPTRSAQSGVAQPHSQQSAECERRIPLFLLRIPTTTAQSAESTRRLFHSAIRNPQSALDKFRTSHSALRIRQIRNRQLGQSTLEYAVFSAVVAAALVGMQLYVRRSVQANLKMLEDQINAEAVPR